MTRLRNKSLIISFPLLLLSLMLVVSYLEHFKEILEMGRISFLNATGAIKGLVNVTSPLNISGTWGRTKDFGAAYPNSGRKRILWWTTVYRDRPQFHGLGWNKTVLSRMNKACNSRCEFVLDKSLANTSHVIIFHAWFRDLFVETVQIDGKNVTRPKDPPPFRNEDQYYVYWCKEVPIRMVTRTPLHPFNNFFNWTASHRLDSDFPLLYGRFVEKTKDLDKNSTATDGKKLLVGKTKLVSWIVSNCNDTPSERFNLVKELKKYIPVDIYGKCGSLRCNSSKCHRAIGKSYKFYLAFENSLCLDYVTEKFFKALQYGMVPIVYGKANYGHQFPPGSFINVDSFGSGKALANHLRFLDRNDEEYLKYFKWRDFYNLARLEHGTLPVFCDICERVHRDYGKRKSTLDLEKWLFHGRGKEYPICTGPQRF